MTTIAAPLPLPHQHRPGSIRAAWSYRAFRLIWIGQALSNTGSWMQNVALPAYVQSRWDSGTLVGFMVFAQLGPLLLLSIPGSVVASRLPRKPWLMTMPAVQMVAAFGLAALVSANAGFWWLFAANAVMGSANALNAPAFQSSIPLLVDRRDLVGAISLNTAQLNGTRVVGPLIAGALMLVGASVSELLIINAVTYLFIVGAIAVVDVPEARHQGSEQGWRRLTAGFKIARSRPVLGRLLLTMTIFSLLSLPFIGLFPTIAAEAFHMKPRSAQYSWLYSVFGTGALLGGLSVASIFHRSDKERLIAPGLIGFAVFLFAFGQARSAVTAFPIGFLLGACYFTVTTAMNTVFQQRLADHERVLVMALWFMAFGGTVPVGNLIFGPVIDGIGPRWVLGMGAVVALWLAWWCNTARLAAATERSGPERRNRQRDALEPGDPAALHEHGAVAPD
jgi:MFS family permease